MMEAKAPSLEERVFLTLEEEILSGALAKGEALTELALSERLGASRTPIRGALHRLAEDGLVAVTPNRGAVVLGIDENDLVDIYEIRRRLEGLASASAAKSISAEELDALRGCVELSEFYMEKNNADKIKELDTEFHHIIYRAAGNRQLEKILSELHRKIKAYRKLSLSVAGRRERSVAEHREILAAIERGEPELADQLTARHVERALSNVMAAIGGNDRATEKEIK